MTRDADGFTANDEAVEEGTLAPAPPVGIPVPAFFADCSNADEARAKACKMLLRPYSSQIDGIDEMYRRLSTALVLLIGAHGGFEP